VVGEEHEEGEQQQTDHEAVGLQHAVITPRWTEQPVAPAGEPSSFGKESTWGFWARSAGRRWAIPDTVPLTHTAPTRIEKARESGSRMVTTSCSGDGADLNKAPITPIAALCTTTNPWLHGLTSLRASGFTPLAGTPALSLPFPITANQRNTQGE
jgi:hypothetical protein